MSNGLSYSSGRQEALNVFVRAKRRAWVVLFVFCFVLFVLFCVVNCTVYFEPEAAIGNIGPNILKIGSRAGGILSALLTVLFCHLYFVEDDKIEKRDFKPKNSPRS